MFCCVILTPYMLLSGGIISIELRLWLVLLGAQFIEPTVLVQNVHIKKVRHHITYDDELLLVGHSGLEPETDRL